MPDETTPATETDASEEPQMFDRTYVEKLRGEAAKHRTEAKANAEAAGRLAAIEDSQRSETEKLVRRAEMAEAEAGPLRIQNNRLTVALAKGLPAALASRLSGSTVEEIEADADALSALVAAPPPPPSMHGGARTQPAPNDMNAFLRQLAGG